MYVFAQLMCLSTNDDRWILLMLELADFSQFSSHVGMLLRKFKCLYYFVTLYYLFFKGDDDNNDVSVDC